MRNKIRYNSPWIEQRADPYVYRHTDGKFYFTASVPSYDGIVLRCADTLSGLQCAEEVYIWHKHESGEMSEHIWAPEIHYLDGRWFIYFAAGEKEDIWKIRPFVLECTGQNPMCDPWVEHGKMKSAQGDVFSFEAFSLDATVFENKGEHYYVWAEKVSVGPQISNLYIARMHSPTQLETIQVMLTTPDYDWERVGFWVNEGASAVRHAGRIYLTYSASETGACYCMGMLSASEDDDLLDPRSWKKERHPVLKTDASLGIYGPGHNSFTTDEQGNDVMVYHARTTDKIEGNPLYNPNRHAMLMKIKWDEQDRPIFSLEDDER